MAAVRATGVNPPRAAGRAAPECRRVRKLTKGPPRTTSTVGIPSLEHFLRGFKLQPGMVLHVTLEYTVPHLGFTTALTYGGLGKARPQAAPAGRQARRAREAGVPVATWCTPEPAACLARAVEASARHCSYFDSWGCYQIQASVKPLGSAAASARLYPGALTSCVTPVRAALERRRASEVSPAAPAGGGCLHPLQHRADRSRGADVCALLRGVGARVPADSRPAAVVLGAGCEQRGP